MKTNKGLKSYPCLQVTTLFAVIGSVVGGLIAQLGLLFIFRDANFAQIGYQPLLYVSYFGFIPALLTGIVLASKKLRRADKGSIQTSFLAGFVISALYIATIIIYLGIHSPIELGVMLTFMSVMGLFGGVNSVIASSIALPKVCKSGFDITPKKEDDSYKRLTSTQR